MKILVAEDEPLMLMAIEAKLKNMGFEVVVVADRHLVANLWAHVGIAQLPDIGGRHRGRAAKLANVLAGTGVTRFHRRLIAERVPRRQASPARHKPADPSSCHPDLHRCCRREPLRHPRLPARRR